MFTISDVTFLVKSTDNYFVTEKKNIFFNSLIYIIYNIYIYTHTHIYIYIYIYIYTYMLKKIFLCINANLD